MKKPGVICDAFDVIVVPFPFADKNVTLRRPALALSGYHDFGSESGIVVVAMITVAASSSWPFDVPISDLKSTGLTRNCFVRMKLASIDYRRVLENTGHLSSGDQERVCDSLNKMLLFRRLG